MRNQLENYFQTQGEVILPGIDEKVMLPRNVWFRYDGEVKSLLGNLVRTELIVHDFIDLNRSRVLEILEWPMNQLALSAAKSMMRTKKPGIDQMIAYCFPHQLPHTSSMAYVIAKRKDLDRSKSIFADGHESGEFIREISAQRILQEALESENVNLDVTKFEGEDFADIGGLLALRRALRQGVPGLVLPTFKTRPALRWEQVEAFGDF